jgi:hypothetical protein
MSRWRCAALFAISICCINRVALTQILSPSPSPCGPQSSDGRMGVGFKTKVAFSVTYRTTFEQRFADGNAIHRTLINRDFHDSAGRTRNEVSLPCSLGEDGQMKSRVTVSVQDPATHTVMSWEADGPNKIVRLIHLGVSRPMPAAPAPTPDQIKTREALQQYWNTHRHTEKLGTRTIDGVECEGTKQVTTIPAGEQGNDLPIVSSTEFWIARSVGLLMLQINDDPRTGRTVIEVADISLTEPPASLFTPPPGYKIEEVPIRTEAAQ